MHCDVWRTVASRGSLIRNLQTNFVRQFLGIDDGPNMRSMFVLVAELLQYEKAVGRTQIYRSVERLNGADPFNDRVGNGLRWSVTALVQRSASPTIGN
jgi:hypothetical protein